MKLYITPEALKGSSDHLLAPGALSALKRLEDTGVLLFISTGALTPNQQELIENEELELHALADGEDRPEEAVEQNDEQYEFVIGEKPIEQADSWSELVQKILYPSRTSEVKRDTEETKIRAWVNLDGTGKSNISRSEEHTSELQSRGHLVCRLLLEK